MFCCCFLCGMVVFLFGWFLSMCKLKALQSYDFLWCFVYNTLFRRIMWKEGSHLLLFPLSYPEAGEALSIHQLGSDNHGCRESWGNMSFSRNHWKHGDAAHCLYGILSSFQRISVPKWPPFPRDEAQKDQDTWISPRFLSVKKKAAE